MSALAGQRAAPRSPRAVLGDYLALTKPRIIVLLEVTTLAAMVMAARGWPESGLVLVTLLGGALAAAGANTINCWYDRDIDADMGRTRLRPIPDGRVDPVHALVFGVSLGVASFVLLATVVNLLSAVLAMAALLFYVLVYTMYLKRSSAQNVVIGGAAGAVPPLVGYAAVTGRLDLLSVFLFAIIFYWTPPHFWALAMLIGGDYRRARVPMLPVVAGNEHTRKQILLYTVIMLVVTALPCVAGVLGAVYAVGAAGFGAVFLWLAVALYRRGGSRAARRLFYYSLLYLAALFAVMAIDRIVSR